MLTAEEEVCNTRESTVPGLLSCHASTSGLFAFVPELICYAICELTTVRQFVIITFLMAISPRCNWRKT